MVPLPASVPSEKFIHELRNALNHLYDPDFLRSSPLVGMLGLGGRYDTPLALQNLLTRAIDQLKPGARTPNKLHAQAIYDLLLYRYVQQFNQDEIANQLGISVRHLRRQQNQAIYELAASLWAEYHNTETALPAPDSFKVVRQPVSPVSADQFTEELFWLKQPPGQTATDLALALEAAHLLIQPFAEQNNAHLIFPSQPAGLLQVHPVAFQQILLGLLTFIIQHTCQKNAPAQEIHIEMDAPVLTGSQGWQTLLISAALNPGVQPQEDSSSLETVRKMIELSQGTYRLEQSPTRLFARAAFRSVEPITVLVIDDNLELITMMKRFTVETRYRILGLNDPAAAIEQALRIMPDQIVLDIMMPQVDGLQVLSRIKHHPTLSHIPVIVCSVLPQKDLASVLGAAGFIQKPIQREVFLTALDKAGH